MSTLSSFHDDLNVAIIGASGGIGNAIYHELKKEKSVSNIHSFSRKPNSNGNEIELKNEESIQKSALIAAEKAPLDIIILTTGILHLEGKIGPEKSLTDLSSNYLEEMFAVNTIGPALIMKYFLPLLNRKKKSVFAALSVALAEMVYDPLSLVGRSQL